MQVYEYSFTRNKVGEAPLRVTGSDMLPIGEFAQGLIGTRENEALLVFALDSRGEVIGYEQLYAGTVDEINVRVGEVFRFAVRVNARGIVIVHNHPSDDPTPSEADARLTETVHKAGELMNIDLLDHLIVTETKVHSLRKQSETLSNELMKGLLNPELAKLLGLANVPG